MTFSIKVDKRVGTPEDLRQAGKVPGVVYGPEMKPVSVSFGYREFEKLLNQAGEANLIDCEIEGGKEPVKVLIQDVQYDPVKSKITHFDLRQISLNKVMTATVELVFVGESPAVKELGGTLMKTHDQVDIKCLPKDLVGVIEVDLSGLKTFEDVIHVKDLVMPPGIEVEESMDMVIAKVAAPLTEEQIKALEEEGKKGVENVEAVEKKKEEVAVEGAEAAKTDAGAKKEEKKDEKK